MDIEKLMDSGEKVSIYPGRREVNNGEIAVFGPGILNVDEDNTEFYIKVKNSVSEGVSPCSNYEILISDKNININLNNKKKILIGIIPKNAEKGIYVFDVTVESLRNQYGDLKKKIYVKVR